MSAGLRALFSPAVDRGVAQRERDQETVCRRARGRAIAGVVRWFRDGRRTGGVRIVEPLSPRGKVIFLQRLLHSYPRPVATIHYWVVQMMQKITVKYRFTRAENSVAGFQSSNRASTDALTALLRWKAGATGRDFRNLADEDEYIDVEVSCNANDIDAGVQLEIASEKMGVERNVLT